MNHLVLSAHQIIFQPRDLFRQIEEDGYILPITILSESTIGMHVRHVIKYYLCLIKGVQENQLGYDARERSILIESDTVNASNCYKVILTDLDAVDGNSCLKLRSEQYIDERKFSMQTSFKRQLSYVIEHSIRHFAMIKMGCRIAFSYIVFQPNFGVIFFTIKYRKSVHSNVSAPK